MLTNALSRWPTVLAATILLGAVGGALAERRPSTAVVLCVMVVAIVGLAMLGDRAFPWAIVLVVTLPWYPFTEHSATPGGFNQKAVSAALAAAPLMPWLWSLAFGGSRTQTNPLMLLVGVLFAGLTVVIFTTFGHVSKMIDPGVVGFLFIGVTFLCARRFVDGSGWPAAGFAGLAVLLLLGVDAAATVPGGRVGYFAGYPITYGALVVGLLPLGLLFAFPRSRLLALLIVIASAVLLVLSESRSSWVAVGVELLLFTALLARRGNLRGLAVVGAGGLIVISLVVGTGSLHSVVNERINSKVASSQSVTHRAWSYSYAINQIEQRPLFGAGAPGYAAEQAANRTNIGAIDNGYLSVGVDLGLVGLAAALIPIIVGIVALGRCMRLGVAPPLEVALALGIIGIATVTAFYDSFYWGTVDLLLGAMGGVLYARMKQIAPVDEAQPHELAALRELAEPSRGPTLGMPAVS